MNNRVGKEYDFDTLMIMMNCMDSEYFENYKIPHLIDKGIISKINCGKEIKYKVLKTY